MGADPVQRPAHYTDSPVETIDFIRATLTEDQFVGFCIGNWMKYKDRAEKKNGLEDHNKAQWYKQMAMHVREPDRYPDPRIARLQVSIKLTDEISAALKNSVPGVITAERERDDGHFHIWEMKTRFGGDEIEVCKYCGMEKPNGKN